jgi:hypothetical protein
MKSPAGKMAVVVMVVLSLGLHWTLLQSAAWLTMLVDYAQQGTFQEALSKTFDGKHPCQICLFIKEGKQTEKNQQTALVQLTQPDLFMEQPAHFTIPKLAPVPPAPAGLFGLERRERPPVPPPRIT